MKRELYLFRGTFNYSREVIVKYSCAPTWAKAKTNMIEQLAGDHGVSRESVKAIFNGDRDNYKIEIDPEWRMKHGWCPETA